MNLVSNMVHEDKVDNSNVNTESMEAHSLPCSLGWIDITKVCQTGSRNGIHIDVDRDMTRPVRKLLLGWTGAVVPI
jgi:hypothetical protein